MAKTSRTRRTRLLTAAIPKARRTASNSFLSYADPTGSYTGTCTDNEYEVPIQDADDL